MLEIADKDWQNLIFKIYAAGLDNDRWGSFLEELNQLGGHAAMAMFGHDLAAGANLGFITRNFDESFKHSYHSYYAALNPWLSRAARSPPGTVQIADAVLPHQDLVRTEFYNDWIVPQEDISAGVGITLHRAGNRILRLSCNIRRRDAEIVQPRMFELMQRLVPHLMQALDLTRQLAGMPLGQHYIATLDLVPSAVFLLDAQGRLCHANALAQRLIGERRVILSRNGRAMFGDSTADRILSSRLAAIAAGRTESIAGTFPVQDALKCEVRTATLAPFIHPGNAQDGFMNLLVEDRPVAILFLDEPAGQSRTRMGAFARAFNLTTAEQELARALYTGQSLQMAADARRISIHTARNQLKSIFSKTSVSRQNQLMALMVQHISRFDRTD